MPVRPSSKIQFSRKIGLDRASARIAASAAGSSGISSSISAPVSNPPSMPRTFCALVSETTWCTPSIRAQRSVMLRIALRCGRVKTSSA